MAQLSELLRPHRPVCYFVYRAEDRGAGRVLELCVAAVNPSPR